MALNLVKNVAFATVSKLRQNPSMRNAMDTILFTGAELIMAVTCVGGPIILGGTWKRTAKTTFKFIVNFVFCNCPLP
jgi:hypothetical protein